MKNWLIQPNQKRKRGKRNELLQNKQSFNTLNFFGDDYWFNTFSSFRFFLFFKPWNCSWCRNHIYFAYHFWKN